MADPTVSLNIILIDILVFGIEKLLEIPYSFITMPRLSVFSWILFIVAGITLLLLRSFRRLKYLLPALIIGFLISSVISVSDNTPAGVLEVNFLDTGVTKSAVFIKLPDRENMLIDGGYTRFGGSGYTERAVIARYLLSRGVRKIDYLILSASDKDHLKGVKYLLENFTVKKFFTNGDKLDGDVWEIIYERGIDWRNLLKMQDRLAIGESELEILRPGSDFGIKDSSLPYPIALKLTGPNMSLLIGEAINTDTVQKSLLGLYGERLRSRVLYMPEIEADDTLKLFINTVSPEVLVTDLIDPPGELNNSDWPDVKRPMNIFQTAIDGTVTIETEGTGLVIKTFNGE